MLGHCSYYTISNFVKALKEYSEEFEITVADPVMPGGENMKTEEAKVFDHVIHLPNKRDIRLKFSDKLASLTDTLKDEPGRNNLFKNILTFRFKKSVKSVESNAEDKIHTAAMKKILKNYDVYHYHYLAPEFLSSLRYIPKDKKVLMTFWGSDLFQITGYENYKQQSEAFERADLITVNAIEIRETALAKYGRNLFSKMRFSDFGLNLQKLDFIEGRNNPETIKAFKARYGIPEEKIIITAGYSGSSKQRHIEILKELKTLDERIKRKIFVIIPMTYGLQFESKDYLKKVEDYSENCGFGCKIFTEYMKHDELADFTVSSQIMLNLRDTDAINASMLESVFAGNIVVNGAWLPYGRLKRAGIYFPEVNSFSDINNTVTFIIDNFEEEKKKTSKNKVPIKKYFLYTSLIYDWVNIYKELGFKKTS